MESPKTSKVLRETSEVPGESRRVEEESCEVSRGKCGVDWPDRTVGPRTGRTGLICKQSGPEDKKDRTVLRSGLFFWD